MKDKDMIIALLIDAENISPKYMKTILDELSMYGTPAYKRIYGDWTSPNMASWKMLLLENNLTPIQQFSYTQGKNASDSAMIIDAMDILYSQNCEGFCLVSSDSDFTRLASRLRESRMYVIGMGESKTPMAFKAACDSFKYIDVLSNVKETQARAKAKPAEKASEKQTKNGKQSAKAKKAAASEKAPVLEVPDPAFVPLEQIVFKIRDIIEHDSDEDGYMLLAQVGSILSRLYPDFDTRNYGFSKLHKLVESSESFETRFDKRPGSGGVKIVMVRNK